MNRHALQYEKCVRGLTLIEVLIAAFILAIIGTISYQSLSATIKSKEVIEDNLQKIAKIDRTWLLIETDLRNVLSHVTQQSFGPGTSEDIQPMVLENNSEYWMTLLRGGHANPMGFLRTELIRVGYRVQEETLWRDVWYNLGSVDVAQARQQKVIDNVEALEVRILSSEANSFSAGPWIDRWPQPGGKKEVLLPTAIEVKLQLKDQVEIARVFSLVKGA